MSDIGEYITDAVKTCLQNGMSLPLTVVLLSSNGSVSVLRYFRSESGEPELVEISKHVEGTGLGLPLNVMIADSQGEVARVLFNRKGVETLH
jgi:hypothetical protein